VRQSRQGPRKEVRFLVTLENGYRRRVRDEGRQRVPDAAENKTYGSNTTDQPHETSNATSRNTDKYIRMICHYCQKKGHIRSQCYAIKRAEARKRETDSSVVQHVTFKTEKLDNAKQLDTDIVKVNPLVNTH